MDSLFPHFNNTAMVALLATLFLISRYLIISSKAMAGPPNAKRTAPQLPGAWPFIGHLIYLLLGRSEPLHRKLAAMADKFGPVFTFKIGVNSALVVSSWEIARELFTINDMAVSSRPPLRFIKHIGYKSVMFAFAPYGAYWREIRKIANHELLSPTRLELLKHVRINEVGASLKELYSLWEEKKDDSGGALVELKSWFQDLNLNVVLSMIIGKKYVDVACGDEKEGRRLKESLVGFFKYMGMVVVGDAIPCLGWMDLGGIEKAMKRAGQELDTMLTKWLAEHKRKRALGAADAAGAHQEEDFMDVMLSLLDNKHQLEGYDVDTVIKSTCLALIAGGSETTVGTLLWVVSLLANNRTVLNKAQEELDVHFGKEKPVQDPDISKLVYLQAIVKESLRLYPPAPLGSTRLAMEDFTLAGYHVPKGTWLVLNQCKIHTDPRIYPNPMEFKPERFLIHEGVEAKGQHFEFLPFGGGRRICPGFNFALQLTHLILARLLHAFDFCSPSNEPVDMIENVGFTTGRATPLKLVVSPRLSPHLYA